MDTVLTGTLTETYKILSKKKFIVLAALSIFVTFAAAVLNILSGRSFGVSVINNPSLPVTILNFLTSLLLPLFIIMLTGDMFSGEIKDNSMVMSLVRPISRNKLYISKILSIGISTLVLLLGTFVISFIASLFGGNLSDIVAKLPSNLAAYVFAVIPMLLIAIISAFITQFTRSSSLTVVIMILASVILSSISLLMPQINIFMPTTYLSWYQNFYSTINISMVINEFLYILAYGIIFMFAGTYLFQKKDM